jgi:hypothetical protein
VFNTPAHDKVWIRGEMTRRLWLAEKWLTVSRSSNAEKSMDALENAAESLSIFLDYRDRYYGRKFFRRTTALEKEKELLRQLTNKKDEKALLMKLSEYRRWWDRKSNN